MICDIDTIWIDMICLRNLNDRHVWSVHRRCCLCLYNIVEPASYSNSNTDMHCMYLHCVFYTAHRPFFLQNLRGSQRIFWPCEVYANFTKTFCGSYGYAAPEVNPRRQAFSEKAGKEFRVKSSDFKSLWSRWFIGDSKVIQRWLLGLVAEPSKQSKIIVIKKLKDNGTSKQGSSLWKMGLIVDEFLLASVGMWSNSPWRRYHYADIKVWLGRTTLVCYDVWNVPNVVVEWCEFYNRVESLLYILIRFIYDVYWGLYIYI